MKRTKSQKFETLPGSAYFVVALLGAILVAFAAVVGKLYLANWRGDVLFLPVGLFLGLLLTVAVVRWLAKKR